LTVDSSFGRIQNSKFKIQNLIRGECLRKKWQKLAKALFLLGFSLLSISRFGRVNTAQQRLLIRVAICRVRALRAALRERNAPHYP